MRSLEHGRGPTDREDTQVQLEGRETLRKVARGDRLSSQLPRSPQSDQEHGDEHRAAEAAAVEGRDRGVVQRRRETLQTVEEGGGEGIAGGS